MTPHRFDPDSVARLRARTVDALDQLADLRSHDPAAASAMRAVRLARHTLEWFWIPTLDEKAGNEPESRKGV